MDALNVVLSRPLGHLDTHPTVAREPELVLGDDADQVGHGSGRTSVGEINGTLEARREGVRRKEECFKNLSDRGQTGWVRTRQYL